jgi:hypothetical protein
MGRVGRIVKLPVTLALKVLHKHPVGWGLMPSAAK